MVELLLKSELIIYFHNILNLRKFNRIADDELIHFYQLFLLILFQRLFTILQFGYQIICLFCDLGSLFIKVCSFLGTLLYLLSVLAYLSDSLEIFMVILNNCNIRLLVFVFKFILRFLLFFLFFLFLLLVFILIFFILLLLLLFLLCLLFELINSFSFSDFVVF